MPPGYDPVRTGSFQIQATAPNDETSCPHLNPTPFPLR